MAPHVEIRNFLGDEETRPLTKGQPLAVGRHKSNDIWIDEDGVGVLHCRISWNKDAFEVVAASPDGVEVNGMIVQRAVLRNGDLIRVGTVDIRMRSDGEPQPVAASEPAHAPSSAELKPISDHDVLLRHPPTSPPAAVRAPPPLPVEAKSPPPQPERSRSKSKKKKSRSTAVARRRSEEDEPTADLFAEEETRDLSDRPVISRSTDFADDAAREFGNEPPERGRDAAPGVDEFGLARLRTRSVRPGEQDALRSPLILMLGGGSLLLLLAALTIYFVMGRQSSQKQYDSAIAMLAEKKYSQGIKGLEEFIAAHPRHSLLDSAEVELGQARIDQQIDSATPAWSRGLEALNQFINEQRDSATFTEMQADIRDYASRIATGAANAAQIADGNPADERRKVLAVAEDAKSVLIANSPSDSPPTDLIQQIESSIRSADLAIRNRDSYLASLANIESAIRKPDALAAFRIRRELITAQPTFANDQRVIRLMDQALDAEQTVVKRDEPNMPAVNTERSTGLRPLSLTPHARVRTDEVSDGRRVVALAKDCCYGIDTITGEPIWRRVIGLDPAFFPIDIATNVSALLLFDRTHHELLLLNQESGELIWRQPFDGQAPVEASGAPLVHEGQIYLPTRERVLYQIDAETGAVVARLTFSQGILGPPVIDSSGTSLYVLGDRDVIYTLSLRPLECRKVSYLEQQPGAVRAPMLAMGSLLLLSENNRQQKSRLRVLKENQQTGRLDSIAEYDDLDSPIDDTPVIRGNQLFVSYGREQVASFAVTDEPGKPALTAGARYKPTSAYTGATFLTAGPDNQFWLAGSALRKLELTPESIEPDPRAISVGLSSQPLQVIGNYLYMGRNLPYTSAVLFTRADRDQMENQWRVVLGSSILASTRADGDQFLCANETGEIYRVSLSELQEGGFKRNPLLRIELSDAMTAPLKAITLDGGRLAMISGRPDPKLWVIGRSGQVEVQTSLSEPLEAMPAAMGDGLVMPLSGKLRFWRTGTPVEEYVAPVVAGQTTKWAHVVGLDATECLAIDTAGTVRRIQLRDAPHPHLAEVSSLPLGSAVDVAPVASNGKVFLAGADRQLSMIDGSSFDVLSKVTLDSPATNALWLEGDRLYVEAGRQHLTCFQTGDELKKLWSVPIDAGGLAGSPQRDGSHIMIVQRDGDVLRLDAETGSIVSKLSLNQRLTANLLRVGDQWIVPTIDGSFARLGEFEPVQP